MFLRGIFLNLIFLFSAHALANEQSFTFHVDNKLYRIILKKNLKTSLKETTIDLKIESKECSQKMYQNFENTILNKVEKYDLYLKKRGYEEIKCKRSILEREMCYFLNDLPGFFQRKIIEQNLLCKSIK